VIHKTEGYPEERNSILPITYILVFEHPLVYAGPLTGLSRQVPHMEWSMTFSPFSRSSQRPGRPPCEGRHSSVAALRAKAVTPQWPLVLGEPERDRDLLRDRDLAGDLVRERLAGDLLLDLLFFRSPDLLRLRDRF